MVPELTIGGLAREAGVNVETVRFYQRRGLMAEPGKQPGGYRRYGGEAIARVRFIKRAQRLGFTLDEVASLLELDQARACAHTSELASQKLALIESKLADLTAMHEALARLRRQCDGGSTRAGCPIIHALAAG